MQRYYKAIIVGLILAGNTNSRVYEAHPLLASGDDSGTLLPDDDRSIQVPQ